MPSGGGGGGEWIEWMKKFGLHTALKKVRRNLITYLNIFIVYYPNICLTPMYQDGLKLKYLFSKIYISSVYYNFFPIIELLLSE